MSRRASILLLLPALLLALLGAPPAAVVAPAPGTVSFTASGDFAATTATTGVLDAVAASDSQLHLALGDLSYGVTGQEGAWCDLVTSRLGAGFPFELLAGNHESNGQNGNVNEFSACLPNQLPGVVGTYGRQWYVDVPQQDPVARMVMISPALPFPDGTWSYAAGTPRYQWTAAAIDGARAAGIPWVVVGMHKPCLSLGQYACDPGTDVVDLLVGRRVDLVLSGHEHLYQRTHQLALSAGCPTLTPGQHTPACVAGTGATLPKGAGTVFATVGTGGVGLRDVALADPERPYFAAWSGANVDPTWGSMAVQVTADRLDASFLRGAGGTFADTWSITRDAAPANQPPVAALAVPVCTALACSFDASASSDVDGTLTWRWDLGDGSAATGPTTTRTFAAPGTYTATVTVTDDDGASAQASRTVTVTAGAPPPLASDDFGRAVASGWGSADAGGPWSVTSSSATSVSQGVGRVSHAAAGTDVRAYLPSVTTSAADVRASVSTTASGAGVGSGLYVDVLGRRVGTGYYSGRLKLLSNGALQASVMRVSGAEATIGAAVTVPGGTYVAGEQLQVRLQVTGTSPTTVRWKVWRAGAVEPTAWTVQTTDSTAGLQAAGHVGYRSYLSSSATALPRTTTVDALRLQTAP